MPALYPDIPPLPPSAEHADGPAKNITDHLNRSSLFRGVRHAYPGQLEVSTSQCCPRQLSWLISPKSDHTGRRSPPHSSSSPTSTLRHHYATSRHMNTPNLQPFQHVGRLAPAGQDTPRCDDSYGRSFHGAHKVRCLGSFGDVIVSLNRALYYTP